MGLGDAKTGRWGSRRRELRVSCLICRISVFCHSLAAYDKIDIPHIQQAIVPPVSGPPAPTSFHKTCCCARKEGKGRMRRGIGEKTRRRSGCKGWTSRTGRRNEVYWMGTVGSRYRGRHLAYTISFSLAYKPTIRRDALTITANGHHIPLASPSALLPLHPSRISLDHCASSPPSTPSASPPRDSISVCAALQRTGASCLRGSRKSPPCVEHRRWNEIKDGLTAAQCVTWAIS